MRNLTNFLAFQIGWFGTVWLAAAGRPWAATLPMLLVIALHLALEERRRREAFYIATATLAGIVLDSLLWALDVTAYASPPAAAWPAGIVPPWIAVLWAGFATLPRRSLSWLGPYPLLAAALGALGGPLSFLGGERMGAVSSNPEPLRTWVGLAIEYAAVTPLLLGFHRWLYAVRHFAPAALPTGEGALPRPVAAPRAEKSD